MEEYDFYPPKPELIERKVKGNPALTILSIVIFAITFLLIFSDGAGFVLNLIIVLLIHEMGHFLMMKFFKYQNVRMLFIPLMGAFVQGSKEEYSQRESLLVTGAGPFPGIVIGTTLIILASTYKETMMVDLGLLFLLLNLINIVPLDPLDGGQLFKLLIKRNQELFILIFSLVSSLILIGIGLWINSWVLILFGFFMGFRVRSLQNQYHLRKELKEENVNYRTTYKLLSNRDFSKIKNILVANSPTLKMYIDNVPEEESQPMLASQVNSILLSPVKDDASTLFKFVVILIWISSLLLPFILFFLYSDSLSENYEWYFQQFSTR